MGIIEIVTQQFIQTVSPYIYYYCSAYPSLDNADNLKRSPTSWYRTHDTVAMRAIASERHRTRDVRARLSMDITSVLQPRHNADPQPQSSLSEEKTSLIGSESSINYGANKVSNL